MKTNIIATIGPVSQNPEMLKSLLGLGFDIARMNFSHCTEAEYIERKKIIKKYAGENTKILADLCGPRIRVGELPTEGVTLVDDQIVTFNTDKKTAKKEDIIVEDPYLHSDLKISDPLLLANGLIETEVIKIEETRIFCKVISGGVLFSRKAINVPYTILTTSAFTTKDAKDLEFALSQDVDFVALSFVQSAQDIKDLRKRISNEKVKIIAKIERKSAVENIDEIIKASDGVMIARGDLGVELPYEDIPIIQKEIIRRARFSGKKAITATQMLSSMVHNPHPTRAEVSDIANAIIDGSTAVMLSDETASGNYPLESLATMRRVAERMEAFLTTREFFV